MLKYLWRKGDSVSNFQIVPKKPNWKNEKTNEAKYKKLASLGKVYMRVPYTTIATFL